jgi:hypothetical protein
MCVFYRVVKESLNTMFSFPRCPYFPKFKCVGQSLNSTFGYWCIHVLSASISFMLETLCYGLTTTLGKIGAFNPSVVVLGVRK